MIKLKNIFNYKLLWAGCLVYLLTVTVVTNIVGGTYAYSTTNLCPNGYSLSAGMCRYYVGPNNECPRGYLRDNNYCKTYPKTGYTFTLTIDDSKKRTCTTTWDSPKNCTIALPGNVNDYGAKNCTPSTSQYSTKILMGNDKKIYSCKPMKTFTATFDLNGGTIPGNSSTNITRSCSTAGSSCEIPLPPDVDKQDKVFGGWIRISDTKIITGTDILSSNQTYAVYWQPEKTTPPATPSTEDANGNKTEDANQNNSQGNNSGETTEDKQEIIFVTKPIPISYYKITYDLNGGKFIDGNDKNRVEYVSSTNSIGSFKTNPIKEGYKFVEWQLNGERFDFSTKPTSDITLTAVYEPFDEYENYSCEEGYDVFDPNTTQCYKVLKPDNENTYNYTNIKYNKGALYCWGYYTEADSNDERIYVLKGSKEPYTKYTGNGAFSIVNNLTDGLMEATGKNNKTYEEYDEQDWWVSKNTCQIGTTCTEKSTWRNTEACDIRYDSIVYSSKTATYYDLDEEIEENEPTDDIPDDSDITIPELDDSNNSNNSDNLNDSNTKPGKENEEVESNVKTGDILISVVIIMLFASLFGVIYFINNRQTENN